MKHHVLFYILQLYSTCKMIKQVFYTILQLSTWEQLTLNELKSKLIVGHNLMYSFLKKKHMGSALMVQTESS